MSHSLYNAHRHQRKIKNKKFHSTLDLLMFIIALAGPIMTIPQVYDMYSTKRVVGFSSLTWGSYTLFTAFWIIYAAIHKEKPVLLQSLAFLIVNALVFVGIFLFQK